MNNFIIEIQPYAKTHYIKLFKKEYKKKWDLTEKALIDLAKRIDKVLKTPSANKIIEKNNVDIIKLEFVVSGMHQSKKHQGTDA